MHKSPQRRACPVDLGPASSADTKLPAPQPENVWIQPVPDARILADESDPAERAATRETIRLAFVAALQHLPPKQRAVLILREVLRWKADEVAELLDTSVASVNSALQRARATLAERPVDVDDEPTAVDPEEAALLARYVDCFERYDITELVELIHDDAVFTMPPFALWLRGTTDIAKWYTGQGAACEGSRLLQTRANGYPAFAAYKSSPDGGFDPFSIQLIEISGGEIVGLHHFLGAELFALFGMPDHLDD
jgi:RNA polymerase sigma-70 factor (ECF subfamily)